MEGGRENSIRRARYFPSDRKKKCQGQLKGGRRTIQHSCNNFIGYWALFKYGHWEYVGATDGIQCESAAFGHLCPKVNKNPRSSDIHCVTVSFSFDKTILNGTHLCWKREPVCFPVSQNHYAPGRSWGHHTELSPCIQRTQMKMRGGERSGSVGD